MNLWLGAISALFCALAGAALGRWFGQQKTPWWAFGYFIPLAIVLMYAVAFHFPSLMFTPPVSWLTMGLKKFAVLGFVETMILTTPLSRLPQRRDRKSLAVLMAVLAFFVGVWPFLAPAFARPQLAQLKTKMDENGVCLQTTDYTCGPAAAVTALYQLGFNAEEGDVAIASGTSNQEGTQTDLLAAALTEKYGRQGLLVKCRAFKNVEELRSAGVTLAVVKYSLLVDHWVAVLRVTKDLVIIGDPAGGLVKMSYSEFAERWRFIGIVLTRKTIYQT